MEEGCKEVLYVVREKVTFEKRLKRREVSKPWGHLEGQQSGHRKQPVQRP